MRSVEERPAPPGEVAAALFPEPSPRRVRQILIGALITACAVMRALVCIHLTVTRQRERDKATNVALELCEQVEGVGQRCAADPATLPWADPGGDRALPTSGAGPPALQPLPPRYRPGPPAGSAPTDGESGTAQAAMPATDAAVTTVEVIGGRLVLTYDDGSRVDAGPVAGDLFTILRQPSPTPTPSRSPNAELSPAGLPSPAPEEPTETPSGGPS